MMDIRSESDKIFQDVLEDRISVLEGVERIVTLLEKINSRNIDFSEHLIDRSRPYAVKLFERENNAKNRDHKLTKILIFQALGVTFSKEEINIMLSRS